MRKRLVLVFERSAALLSRLAPRGLCDPRDVSGTVREVCEDAHRHRGWRGLIATGVMECADVTRTAVGARLGAARLSVSAGIPNRPAGERSPRGRSFIDDLRHALHRLRVRPGTSSGAAAMLALAVGVTAAMFTILDALILRPVPFRHPGHLAHVVVTLDKSYVQAVPPALLRTWRSSPVFEAVHGMVQDPAIIEGGPEPISRGGARVTPGLFEMLGVRPLLGRTFVDGEGRAGTDDRVIISEEIWRAQFGAAPDIIGRRVPVSGAQLEVVGVMPANFHFPYWTSSIWRPIDFNAPPPAFVKASPWVYARRAESMPADAAAKAAADAMHRDAPGTSAQGVRFDPLVAGFLDSYSKTALTALAIGVGLVFLALCANVTSLVLARMTSRRRELAVCAALGAARTRLLRQALIENLAIGVVGSAAGLAIGVLLISLARHYLPEGFMQRTLNPVAIDLRAVAATSIAGLVATLLAGIAPAWLGTRIDAATTMHLRERGTTASRAERALSRGLLVAEMALAVALLVGAGLLLRSFVNLSRADRGLDAEGVVTGWISLPSYAFADRPARFAYADALDATLRQLPGVSDLALSYGMPPGSAVILFGTVTSDLPDAAAQKVVMNASSVTNDFFRVYRIRLLEGRLFEPSDTSSDAIVGAQLAKLLWPGTSAVGHTFTLNGTDVSRVVGVVNEIRSPSNDPREDRPEIYMPLRVMTDGQVQARAFGTGNINFGLRCASRCPDLEVVRRRVRAVDPHALIAHMGPLDEEFIGELARPRAAAALAIAFAVVTTLVASGGIFSVLSYAVGRRLRQFGIRAAMGARPRQLQRLVLADALRIGAAGLALGIAAAWALGRSLTALAYGVTGADPVTWTTVLGVLAAVTIAASWRPARHAMRADPVTLLRDE